MYDDDELKHRGFGIASFSLAVFSSLALIIAIVIAGVMSVTHLQTPESNVYIGSALLITCFLLLISIGLGIAGALDKTSKKALPILGITISVGVLLLSTGVIYLGLRVSGKI